MTRFRTWIVIADKGLVCGTKAGAVNPSVFRPNQTILDVSDPPLEHPLFTEARERGCRVVEPSKVYTDQLQMQSHSAGGSRPADGGVCEALE